MEAHLPAEAAERINVGGPRRPVIIRVSPELPRAQHHRRSPASVGVVTAPGPRHRRMEKCREAEVRKPGIAVVIDQNVGLCRISTLWDA